MYYIDTSILVAYYCPETLSEQVQAFLGEQFKPVVSDLTNVEIISIVSPNQAQKVARQDLTPLYSPFLSAD